MSPDASSPRYRRRNRWPIAVVIAVLLAGTVVVWAQVLKPEPPVATGCNKPSAPPATETTGGASSTTSSADTDETDASSTTGTSNTGTSTTGTAATGTAATGTTTPSTDVSTELGTFTDPNTLAATRPADPGRVPLRVLNASGVSGQAGTVTAELRAAGFTSIREGEDDPLYPLWDLHCVGEIRYGYAGLAEARTVLLVAPCAQLVRDDRADNSVDLSLGKLYEPEPISDEVHKELEKIANASAPSPVLNGETISVRPVPTIPPLPSRADCPA